MKKLLIAFLALCTVGMTAYAAPAFEAPEGTAEMNGEVYEAELSGTYQNGINLITGTTAKEDFESFETTDTYAAANSTFSLSNCGAATIEYDTESGNKYLKLAGVDVVGTAKYTHAVWKFPSAIPADHYYYVSFKVYQHGGEPNFWIQGASHPMSCASDLNILYRSASNIFWLNTGLFGNILQTYQGLDEWKTITYALKSTDAVNNIDLYYPCLGSDGYLLIDDLTVTPYVDVKYYMNDGTDTVFYSEPFLINESGAISGTYTINDTLKPTRPGYEFVGWTPLPGFPKTSSVTFSGMDLNLYAIWEEKEIKSYVADFEDGTNGFLNSAFGNTKLGTVANGRLPITYEGNEVTTQGAAYVQVMSMQMKNSDYPYMLFKSDKEFTGSIYYSVGQDSFSPNFTVSPKVVGDAADGDVWLLADFSEKSDYLNDAYIHKIMIAIRTIGTFSLDEVAFVGDYEEYIANYDYSGKKLEYHFNISKKLSTLGETKVTYTRSQDGKPGYITVEKPASGDFAFYLSPNKMTLDTMWYKTIVFKTDKSVDAGSVYFTTSDNASFAEGEMHVSLKKYTLGDYAYLYYDFTGNSKYTGNINKFMVQLQGNIYDIYLTNGFDKLDYAGWDFEGTSLPSSITSGWGNLKITGVANGKATLVRDVAGQGGQGALNSTLQVDASKKFVVIRADKPTNFHIYFQTAASGAMSEANSINTSTLGRDSDGQYVMIGHFIGKEAYTGTITSWMIGGGMADGTYYVDDIAFVSQDELTDYLASFGFKADNKELNIAGSSFYDKNTGLLTFNGSNYFSLGATGAICDLYDYFVIRGPKDNGLGLQGGVYYTLNGSGHSETNHVPNGGFKSATVGDYDYLYFQISKTATNGASVAPWTGLQTGNGFMLQVHGVMDKIYYTDDISYITGETPAADDDADAAAAIIHEDVTVDFGGIATDYEYGAEVIPMGIVDTDDAAFLGWSYEEGSEEIVDVNGLKAIENITFYPVWKDCKVAAGTTEYAHQNNVGANTYDGLRFNASVTDEQYTTADEYGFITTLSTLLSDAAVDAADFTKDAGVKYVEGVAFNKTEGIDIHKDIDDTTGDVSIAAFVYSASGNLTDTMEVVVRPYIVFDFDGVKKTFYGSAMVDKMCNHFID